jgi:hypothetical protein
MRVLWGYLEPYGRPRLAGTADRVDSGAQSAGQRPRGAWVLNRTGPAGEGLARGRNELPGRGECLSGAAVPAMVEPDAETRLDGTVAMRFHNEYLRVEVCAPPQRVAKPKTPAKPRHSAARKCRLMQGIFEQPALPLGKALAIANATS